MNVESERNTKFILKKINEIVERSAGGKYIFRGEPKRYKKVTSTLYRQYKKAIDSEHFDIEVVQEEMLQEAERYKGAPSKLEILTELQHYGGRTNLVDFTTDFLIALFFACDGHPKKDGRVILLRRESVKGQLREPHHPKNRVISQKSVFVQPPKGFVEPNDVVLIPRDLKQPTLNHLEKYHGISAATIYNDLHGFIATQRIHKSAYTEFFRGLTYQKREDHKKAIRHYTKSIELNPNHTGTYNNRGIIYLKEGEYDGAIKDFDAVIARNPKFADAHCQRGVAYLYKREYDQAIADFDKAIELKPDDALAYNNLGAAYEEKGQIDKALANYLKAIKLDSDLADAHYNCGVARLRRKEWDEAGVDLRNAESKGKDVITAFCRDHRSVEDFEKQHGVNLPKVIRAVLAPRQGALG